MLGRGVAVGKAAQQQRLVELLAVAPEAAPGLENADPVLLARKVGAQHVDEAAGERGPHDVVPAARAGSSTDSFALLTKLKVITSCQSRATSRSLSADTGAADSGSGSIACTCAEGDVGMFA